MYVPQIETMNSEMHTPLVDEMLMRINMNGFEFVSYLGFVLTQGRAIKLRGDILDATENLLNTTEDYLITGSTDGYLRDQLTQSLQNYSPDTINGLSKFF